MMRDQLGVLAAFIAVAEKRSFTSAAKQLGVSPSALSHAIRGLEERMGVRLLARTTRSVAPTEAGEALFTRVRPAFGDIHQALEQASSLRDRPAGRVRLVLPRSAAMIALVPKLAQFARDYPDVVLEVTTENSRVDLVAGGFDAGIQIGEFIQKDMVAVRVSQDLRPAVVGSPRYFASHPRPKHPRDLLHHACINFRLGSSGVYRWEFDKGKRSLTVAVEGPLIVDDAEMTVRAAVDGIGVAFALEHHAAPFISAGKLVRVLADWCPPFPGYFLYYPSRRQQPAALTALIDTLRLQDQAMPARPEAPGRARGPGEA
jgi:DNA-binding transcriptional LysR family regulator